MASAYAHWFSVTGSKADLPPATRLPELAARLETAFDSARGDWWNLARDMGRDHPSARWSHTAAAGSYGSDFGLTLAWTRLTADCAEDTLTTLVVCDDPWLFRQLENITGVDAGRRPVLWSHRLRNMVRGVAARFAVAVRVARACIELRKDRGKSGQPGRPAMIVYGHPGSQADGHDAYFGDLMTDNPALLRMLHTDCGLKDARRLGVGQRTASLHAWGSAFYALVRLPFAIWRPSPGMRNDRHGWLIRRAASRENRGGGPAMNCWQMYCQKRWLADRRPATVIWPWENHAWERALVRNAKSLGVRTVGYQHAVIGRHQFNFSPASNPDGLDSIPDTVACNGPGYRSQLESLGIPEDRLSVAGTFRVGRIEGSRFDSDGPVYVALSAIPSVATRMVEAIQPLARTGMRFIVKDHPLYPFAFDETPEIQRVLTTIPETHGMAAVIYSTGTPGLEGLFAGVPTFRLMPEDTVALDIMPDGVSAIPVTADDLAEALRTHVTPPVLPWQDVMAPVSYDVWRELLSNDVAELRPDALDRAAGK